MPPSRKKDQSSPPVGDPADESKGTVGEAYSRAQSGRYLTTAQGLRLPDTDHSLKAGDRGPTLLEDFHLREKITHFDHERIPERVVHARGAAAHGTFEAYGNAAGVTKAGFLAKGVKTDVFCRFSTVLGSRGSADTVRDTRGFAVKFYTEQGNFDLVGNNIPVFFIQDGIKFPDVIHAGKPQPDREIPQAQSAHDTFWDFVSLHTEATHHVFWNMSDRGIPRSYRTMEGFGVHTFRLVNSDGETSLVKFHWKPVAGVHSLVWEEAQIAAGVDPDFHRRDMADGIEAGAPLEYEFGIQVMPDDGTDSFEGIDLLDPTKLVPEELAPVQLIGKLSLDANPTNYFAETEQVAFHTGNLVPGIEVTNDPLMQARLFSYLDTQLTRLGGPNFTQLPINRPRCPVNDMLRDGMHQTAIHTGVAPYRPNSIDGGEPLVAGADEGGYVPVPRPVAGLVERAQPVSFEDHFTQPAMFYRSLERAREGTRRRGLYLRAGQVLREVHQGARVGGARERRCEPLPAGRRRARPPRAEGQPAYRRQHFGSALADRRRAGPGGGAQGGGDRRRRLRPHLDRCPHQVACPPRCVGVGHGTGGRHPQGRTQIGGHRQDVRHRALDRVRRGHRRRGHHAYRRHQAGRAAAGGIQALQGPGRMG